MVNTGLQVIPATESAQFGFIFSLRNFQAGEDTDLLNEYNHFLETNITILRGDAVAQHTNTFDLASENV